MASQFSGDYRFLPHWNWIWLPVFMLLLLLLINGIVFIAATLQVYFRDVAHLINLVIFLWLFMTPVLYPLRAIAGGRASTLIIFNPVTGLFDGIQMALISGRFPWEHHVVFAAVVSVVVFLVGYSFFKHEERFFADVV
jgi:lipopolysaccharide transport system permease protein